MRDGGEAIKYAVANGHLLAVERLIAKNSNGSYEFPAFVENIDGFLMKLLFKKVVALNLVSLSNKLFEIPTIFNRASSLGITGISEANVSNYLESFLMLYFSSLEERRINYEYSHSESVFDFSSYEMELGLSILKYLIKKGNFASVNTLLSIPAVKAKAASNDNELLKLARAYNAPVFRILMAIPAVSDLEIITRDDIDAFNYAAANGYLSVVERLLTNINGIYTQETSKC